jgi:diguanylate cyclase (GGDEF)-like protein
MSLGNTLRTASLALGCWTMLALPSGGNTTPWVTPRPSALPPGRLAFQSYDASQGLGNMAVWSLDQDRDGFLWVGTENGLYRYDGARFQAFGTAEGLPADWVRALRVDGRDRLWIGTTRGLALREAGRIRAVPPSSGLPVGEVFSLALDADNRLWVAMDMGLFRQAPDRASFEPAPGWPARSGARALWVDGATVHATSQSHLFRYDPQAATPVEVPGPWKERLEALGKDAEGRFWVRSRSGLWMRPTERAPFEVLSGKLSPAAYDGYLSISPSGGVLISTLEGLVRVRGQVWERITEEGGLPTPWVNRALEDREGNLWIGGPGLHRSLAREAWRRHSYRDGIPGGMVNAILGGNPGQMWIGTNDGLCVPRGGTWKAIPRTRNQAILALAQGPDGAIWMGGTRAQLRRWVPASDTWLELDLRASTITHLVFDREGVLWVATRREGLFRVRREGDGYHAAPVQLPGAVPGERIQSLVRGGLDRLWMTSTEGLLLWEGGRLRRFGRADGLESSRLQAVFERGDGELWLSYQDRPGISRYSYRAGRLGHLGPLEQRQGLPDRKIYFLQQDPLGRVWIGTSQGLDMLEGGAWHHFSALDGLPDDDCGASAFLATPDGDVWVGTLGGLGHFHGTADRNPPVPPVAHVLSVQDGEASLLPPFPGRIEVPSWNATVEFRFTGLTFLHEHRVQHQVRLLGLDPVWHPSEIRQARYTKLPPGDYQFEVRAGLDGQVWGASATVPIRVLPAWWQTWWCRFLALLALLGGLGAAVHLRLRAFRRRNDHLEQLVWARTQALAEANQTLAQLTVTDPLTGLKNRRFLDLTIAEDVAKAHRDHHFLQQAPDGQLPTNVDLLFFMLDLDHFKRVNDSHGHAAGDALLQQVRDRLLEAVRDTDTVVRWGGEEFLVLTRAFDRHHADRMADRILHLIRSRPFELGKGIQIHQTASLGFAAYPFLPDHALDAVNWQDVVEVADRCLYAAKESGRDRWVGLPRGGPRPESIRDFLSDPATLLAAEAWPLRSSFPEGGPVVWR